MKGVFQIANFAGIPVKLHWSFALLMLWVIYAAVSSGLDATGVILSIVIVSAIFICVVMHEYGHALTARRFGVTTRDIILSPIGGIARLSHIPERPAHELLIAVAGPAVNLVIALALMLVISLTEQQFPRVFSAAFWSLTYEQSVLLIIAKINVFLVAFNLIPAFPMDGGRVLRALLSLRLERTKATLFASYAGSVFALGFVAAGIWRGDVILSLIGIFIFFAANQERRVARLRQRLDGLTVGEICNREPVVLSDSRVLAEALREQAHGRQQDFLVAGQTGQITGVLFAEMIADARANDVMMRAVRDHMSQLFEPVDATMPVSRLLDLFRREGYRLVPVYAGGVFLGSVSREQLKAVMQGDHPTAPPASI